MKVIFLAFANSSSSPLPNLTDEDDEIYSLLSEKYLRGDFIVHRESFATIEKVNAALKKYEGNLAIFHFSGHANKDQLLINDEVANSAGIAQQLRKSVNLGALKLVILNGCSTIGQVEKLEGINVPVVISTSAAIEDKTAKEFSIRFWENLIKRNNTIEDAYDDALKVAQTFAQEELPEAKHRHIATENNSQKPEQPLWCLGGIEENAKFYPIPPRQQNYPNPPLPNKDLIKTFFESLYLAGAPKVITLVDRGNVGGEEKTSTILNTIPNPIGIHLQRLLSPQFPGEFSEDSPNVFGLARLEQIAQFYHTSTEFFAIVMIAQIWELAIKFQNVFVISSLMKKRLNDYIDIDQETRKTYNYISLIQSIREYLTKNNTNGEIKSFIDEQEELSQLLIEDEEFSQASSYLLNLRKQTVSKKINPDLIEPISYETEKHLVSFVKQLGFIHRYNLVSVQQIDILKYRHTKKVITQELLAKTEGSALMNTSILEGENLFYKHRLIRCMQATSGDEYNYYYMPDSVDNWSVMLIKTGIEEILDDEKRRFKVTPIDYLNLSPFVIDKNAFLKNTDLSYIMFFNGYKKQNPIISYQWVRNPMNYRDSLEIRNEENYEPVRLQFNAFEKMIK